MTAIRALADGFPAPNEADWRRLVEKTLKGASPDSLVSHTADGLPIAPLYRSAAPLRAGRAGPGPGGAPWDIRTFSAHADPAEANRRLLEDLEGGANSVILTLRTALEDDGTVVASADDLGRVLAGVDLHLATVALDAGFLGPRAAQWMATLAKAAPRVRMALHLDPLGALARAGRSPGPLAEHVRLAAETAVRLHPTYPQAQLFLASGRAVHEAGGSDAQEIAFAAACAVAYAKAAAEAGLAPAVTFAALTVGISLDADYFTGVAKLRAARMVLGRVAQACGADARLLVEARSSRRMLSTLDPWSNLLRLTCAGFAGAVGGADALALEPFTQPLGGPSELARRLARNTQLILMDEAHLGRVDDPAAGAWFLDTHARELAEAAWGLFQAMESRGGAAEALKSGWLQGQVAAVRAQRQAAMAENRARMIGVNLHPNPGRDPVEVEPVVRMDAPGVDAAPAGADDMCLPLTPVRWAEPFEGPAPP